MTEILRFGSVDLPDALDDVRRFCGLPGAGGGPEVFAYPYFDALEERREDNVIRPVDVLAAGSLHPRLRKQDLAYFIEHRQELEVLLADLPTDVDLADASAALIDLLSKIESRLQPTCGLSLSSKVLHAKRPRLVPMLDRALTDCYRHETGLRGEAAWPSVVPLLAADLARIGNRMDIKQIIADLETSGLSKLPSELRVADIAIWVAATER
jgi:hypothetical protein